MTTAFMLAAIFTRPIIGIIMHKVNMKWLLVAALFFVTGFILLSLGQADLPYLIFLRILHGICFGLVSTLLATFATNLIPQKRLGEGIGYFGMATSLGTTLGPSLALTFVHSFTFQVTLLVTTGIAAFAFIISLMIKNTKSAPSMEQTTEKKGSIWQYAFDKRAFLPSFLVFLFYLTFSGIVNFINGLGEEVHLGGKVSIFFLINAVVTVLIRPFSGKLYDKKGHKFLIYTASVAGIAGLLIMSAAHSFGTLMVAAVIYGVAYGIMQPTFQAWAVSRVGQDKKATANAMALSSMDLGMALGAVLLGGVAGASSYSTMYGLASILIVLLIVFYTFVMIRSKRNKNDEKLAA